MYLKQKYDNCLNNINYISLEWDGNKWTWWEFINTVIGDENPSLAIESSIRGFIYKNKDTLGLTTINQYNNIIHVSKSAFEGLYDRMIWIKNSILYTDLFGCRLMTARFTAKNINYWITNPLLKNSEINLFNYCKYKNSIECIDIFRSVNIS